MRAFNKAADPFAILVRSAEDVEVVAGPPWWRPSTLILVSLVALGLIFALNHLYLLAQHWRLRAVADERERLAHEIHDTLAQSFAGIGFQLQAIRNSLPRDAQVLERQVDRAMSMARTSHEEARRSIASLRPESLGHVGLLRLFASAPNEWSRAAMWRWRHMARMTAGSCPSISRTRSSELARRRSPIRSGMPNPDTIRIRLQQQRTSLCLSVEDDGHGFVAG